MKRKKAIFSDIHGNLQALNAILEDIKNRDITETYCLGDIIAIGPNPMECLDLVIKNNIKMVLGNHELYFVKGTKIDDEMGEDEKAHAKWVREQLSEKHKEFLSNCPLQIIDEIGESKVAFQHFLFNSNETDPYPFDDISIIKDNSIKEKMELLDANITFIGHEHKAFRMAADNRQVIDVGSSGCRKDDNTFYTLVSIEDNTISIEKINLKYNRKEFEKVFNDTNYPDKEKIGQIFFGINN